MKIDTVHKEKSISFYIHTLFRAFCFVFIFILFIYDIKKVIWIRENAMEIKF